MAAGSSGCSLISAIGSLSILGKELRRFAQELRFAVLQYSFFPSFSFFLETGPLLFHIFNMVSQRMNIKLLHPLSTFPKIAFEPVGQLLTNLTARHKSQICQVPADLIKARTLGETGKSHHETELEETWLLWFHRNLVLQYDLLY